MPLPPYFDPLGETEPHMTPYTLTAYAPPRPPNWLAKTFSRSKYSTNPLYQLRADDKNNDLTCFEQSHLKDLPTKDITIKSGWFDPDFRCSHIYNKPEVKTCAQGCYFLERGGHASRFTCSRNDCAGHVYSGQIRWNKDGKACFGEPGKRMVCLDVVIAQEGEETEPNAERN